MVPYRRLRCRLHRWLVGVVDMRDEPAVDSDERSGVVAAELGDEELTELKTDGEESSFMDVCLDLGPGTRVRLDRCIGGVPGGNGGLSGQVPVYGRVRGG